MRLRRRRDDIDKRGYVRGWHNACRTYRLRPVGRKGVRCEVCNVAVGVAGERA